MPLTVTEVAPQERSVLCERILRALPEWFELEGAVREYVTEVADLPTFAVGGDAFLSVKQQTPAAAELYLMRSSASVRGAGSAPRWSPRRRTITGSAAWSACR